MYVKKENIDYYKDINYKKHLHEGGCKPQVAASLILGINPEAEGVIIIDPRDHQNVRTKFKEIDELCDILCDGGLPWHYYQNNNIFEHVEKALKNNVPVDKYFLDLLEVMKEHYLHYLEEERTQFKTKYRYLYRELEKLNAPTPIPHNGNVTDGQDKEDDTSEEERLFEIITTSTKERDEWIRKRRDEILPTLTDKKKVATAAKRIAEEMDQIREKFKKKLHRRSVKPISVSRIMKISTEG